MSSESVSSGANMAITRRFWEQVVNQKDLNVVTDLIATDFTLSAPANPEDDVRGPDGVRNLVEQFHTMFPDFSVTIEDQVALRTDEVVTRWRARGTSTETVEVEPGEFTEPTGAKVECFGTSSSRFSNGKIDVTWMAMVIHASGGTIEESWSAGEPPAFMDRVVPEEGEILEAGEEYYKFKPGKPIGCRLCFCMCCRGD
jgi:hypothetical protein